MLPRAGSQQTGMGGRRAAQRVLVKLRRETRMDSKVPRLALALKKRKASPLHPGGKEVRGLDCRGCPVGGILLKEGHGCPSPGSLLMAAHVMREGCKMPPPHTL